MTKLGPRKMYTEDTKNYCQDKTHSDGVIQDFSTKMFTSKQLILYSEFLFYNNWSILQKDVGPLKPHGNKDRVQLA